MTQEPIRPRYAHRVLARGRGSGRAEAPDTLLLAEAFWLMEGYFVRTLGMHRVYNSAFMNMMRDEKNAEYRAGHQEHARVRPEILKRYVNFMNNPDEKTAVDQFGKGDKYFGVCDGAGDDARAADVRARPDRGLSPSATAWSTAAPTGTRRPTRGWSPDTSARSSRCCTSASSSPRSRTSRCTTFLHADGSVNEDVFAFSNSRDGNRSLIVYHNRYAETSGWIRSAAVSGASLAAGLGLRGGEGDWLVLRDSRSGLEYLRSQRELAEHGLQLTLHAYETRVYSDIRDVRDADGRYARLAVWLGGRGVPSIDDAMLELELQPLHDALRSGDEQAALAEVAALLEVEPDEAPAAPGVERATERADERALARSIETLVAANKPDLSRGKWIYDWLIARVWPNADLVALWLDVEARPRSGRGNGKRAAELLADDRFQRSIGVNEHDGVAYFNKERFSEAVTWLELAEAAKLTAAAAKSRYRLDDLKKLLAEPPKRAPSKPAPARTTKK